MSGRVELKLDPTTGDLFFDSTGSIVMVDDVVQRLKTRLRFFLGEWFLDLTVGTPYLQRILVKAPNLGYIRGALRERILGTEGVARLDRLDLRFDRVTRRLSVYIRAVADNGAGINISGAIP